ncbi:lipoprotein signal peptidase [Plebeiibacterium sediminum]|uniref:Lipoprotein signal peptidase n=1 Tax=Plebeiibacterium sediminum TaxID=2992112 RepID=A0AAE3M4B9_9BACT|nr:lipoprotein signal peptidase [Plebeiobacterium sediminum]MCW3786771.1 lipoprotein signal peptidase [Plebeiobacterium sediminum]
MAKNHSGMHSFLKKPFVIVLLVLFIDQALKIWVKTHMMIGQEYKIIGDWFIIHFIENNGMAFGMELAGKFGKIILSVFRIVAVVGIAYYLKQLSKKDVPYGLIFSISLVLAGAIGNIIDSAFYGMIFNDSYPQVASLFPAEGGYSSFLHGKVVDMFYFPIVEGNFPSWIPKWGGEHFIFFRPVFNVADSAITIGIAIILIFHRKYFK